MRASEIRVMQGVGVQGHLKERVLLLLLPKSLLLRQRSRIEEEDEANVKNRKHSVVSFFLSNHVRKGPKLYIPSSINTDYVCTRKLKGKGFA